LRCFELATKWCDDATGPAQIRNSNSYSLAAQVQNAGGEAVAAGDPLRMSGGGFGL